MAVVSGSTVVTGMGATVVSGAEGIGPAGVAPVGTAGRDGSATPGSGTGGDDECECRTDQAYRSIHVACAPTGSDASAVHVR